MTDSYRALQAAALMRISLGAMFLAHSVILKLMMLGLTGTAKYFSSLGLPGWFAYPVIVAEICSGLLLIFGVKTRWVALLDIPLLAGTIIFEHGHHGWFFAAPGGGWEYPAFLIVTCLGVALSNGGSATPQLDTRSA